MHDRMLERTEAVDGRAALSDGMDIGLGRLHLPSGQFVFAGAQASMMIEGADGVQRVKGDLCSIGDRFGRGNGTYTDHAFDLTRGRRVFLFSDGFPHQFGGPEGRKKYSYKRMAQDLAQLVPALGEGPERQVDELFHTWKGPVEQTDDVLLIGFSLRGTLQAQAA
jgi:serine phosphatase RsbU (regulator of sigma subunit)